MKVKYLITVLSLISVLFFSFSVKKQQKSITLQNLRTEMLVNPEGIDAVQPRLSWEINAAAGFRNVKQEAYRVIVSSSPQNLAADKGDFWDSGKITSDQSIHVIYQGKPLKSLDRCFWKVKVWTNNGETEWSDQAYWSIGLKNPVDWRGRWIGLDRSFPWDSETQWSRLSARYLRKEFELKKEIKYASAHIMGLGLYELYLNGRKVGDQVLAPVPTDYTEGVKYNTFDVTELLKSGANAVGTVLGNGRYYTMRQAYKPYKIQTFGYPKMLINIIVEYTDGSREVIAPDDTWKITADGPIRTNNEYDGEEYDARKEMPGWNKIGFDDKDWLQAEYVQPPGGMYEAQMTENMKVMKTIKPLSLKYLKPDVYIMDMGQNMTGWIRLRVKGNAGDSVKLRFAETLQDNGELFTANLRDARVTDIYTLKGGGVEEWEPSFIYHGFRYVEITGYPGKPTVDDFDGRVVYDDMNTIGEFNTSNATINQVYRNAYWGILGNYKGMPVDCPQRNERQPWLGDRTTGAYGESFIFDNGRLYAKWLDDIQQAQKADGSIPDVAPAFWRYYGDNVTWPGTYISIADMLYHQYADTVSVKKHYDSMKKWVDYMRGRYMQDYIVTKDKYGDWCVPPESKELIHSQDPARKTDGQLLATAVYYKLLNTMKGFAEILNKDEDAAAFDALASKVKTAFNDKFLNRETFQYSNNTVTANILPLNFGMVPEGAEEKVFKNIVDKILVENKGHISTGVIGTQQLMRGLSKYGRPDVAYRIASNRDYPSWGYMAENGATTIWELWNGNTANPSMNSQNHVMLLGDLIVWYYENLAGIKAASPAFKKIIMKPERIEGLSFVNASYHSMYGEIKSSWKRNKGNFSWNISIPANTSALVYIPASSADKVKESGKKADRMGGAKFIKMDGGYAVFEVGSGNYAFTAN